MAREAFQQAELPRLQFQAPAAPAHAAGQNIDLHVRDPQQSFRLRAPRAAPQGCNTCREFRGSELRVEALIGAGIDPAAGIITGAVQQQHRRHDAAAAQSPHDAQGIQFQCRAINDEQFPFLTGRKI